MNKLDHLFLFFHALLKFAYKMSENKRPRIDPSPLEALQSMLNTSIQDPNDASPPTTGMSSSSMILKEIILIGGGHAHVHVIKMIGMKPIPGVRVTVISRDVLTPYSGMLPGYIAGYYSSEQLHIDIMKLTSFAHMRLIHCEAMGLDKIQKLVHLKDGRPSIRYDILSIDIGSCPRPLPSSFTHSNTTPITAVKPIDSFSNRWQMSLQNILQSPPIVPLNVVIVGGGAGGVELTFAIHFRLKQEFKQRQWDFSMITVTLVTRGKHVLTSHNQ